jgi:hypothetical protein
MQKTDNTGRHCEDRAELKSSSGAQSVSPADTEERDDATGDLLAKLVSRDNLNAAYKKVKKNGGAPGADGMTAEEAGPYLKEHKDEIIGRIIKVRGSAFTLPNRRIPNGTYGGVRGRAAN